jgi:hypothetical protein
LALRRRATPAINANPPTSSAQLCGSGTACAGSSVNTNATGLHRVGVEHEGIVDAANPMFAASRPLPRACI